MSALNQRLILIMELALFMFILCGYVTLSVCIHVFANVHIRDQKGALGVLIGSCVFLWGSVSP